MNLFDNIRDIIKRLFSADPVTTQSEMEFINESEAKYREEEGYNITALFADRLATHTTIDSTLDVVGDNQRAGLVSGVMDKVWLDAKNWVATAYGAGGVLLIPYVINKQIYVDAVPQSDMVINRVNGDELRAVTILADSTIQNDKQYFRLTDYSLEDNGMQTIRQRAVNAAGSTVPLQSITEWASITEEMHISGCEHLLLAYVKNPTNSRKKTHYGVPVTYGCDDKIKEIVECHADIRKEYKLKQPIVGMDQTLFDVRNGRRHLPVTGLFMPVTPQGLNTSGKLWDVYDPAIRDTSYYSRLQNLYAELEKQVGTSRGILTEPATHGATATEIKAANLNTYSIVDGMRKVVERALERLAYAVNVLANAYHLTPMGDYDLSFDWSYALIESTQESFDQLLSSVTVDAAEPAEVRMFNHPEESLDEARERVAEIKRNKKDLSDLLLKEAAAAGSRKPLTLEDEEEDDEG